MTGSSPCGNMGSCSCSFCLCRTGTLRRAVTGRRVGTRFGVGAACSVGWACAVRSMGTAGVTGNMGGAAAATGPSRGRPVCGTP